MVPTTHDCSPCGTCVHKHVQGGDGELRGSTSLRLAMHANATVPSGGTANRTGQDATPLPQCDPIPCHAPCLGIPSRARASQKSTVCRRAQLQPRESRLRPMMLSKIGQRLFMLSLATPQVFYRPTTGSGMHWLTESVPLHL